MASETTHSRIERERIMSDTKTRTMTPKGFLAKTHTRAAHSASAFLQAHRDFLTTGDLASVTSPILRKVDDGILMPTPALQEIAAAVMNHIIVTEAQKLADKINNPPQGPAPKPWVATIYNSKGIVETRINAKGEVEDLIKDFKLGQEADRWADLRLFEGASDWFAEVDNAKANLHNRVERLDAISRVLKKSKGPVIHQRGTSTKNLGFGVKAHQDRASFSRG